MVAGGERFGLPLENQFAVDRYPYRKLPIEYDREAHAVVHPSREELLMTYVELRQSVSMGDPQKFLFIRAGNTARPANQLNQRARS